MENVTVTLFVKPDSLISMVTALKILDGLDMENQYTVQPHDIEYTESMISNYTHINVPIELYMKFVYCYQKSKNASLKH